MNRKLVSFWAGLFSGAMLVSGRVYFIFIPILGNDPIRPHILQMGRERQLVFIGISMEQPMNKGFLRDKWYLIRPFYQWIFQVPVKGGRDYITP